MGVGGSQEGQGGGEREREREVLGMCRKSRDTRPVLSFIVVESLVWGG